MVYGKWNMAQHNLPISKLSKRPFKPRRTSKKGKVLDPPNFKYHKISSIFGRAQPNPQVRDESLAKVLRGPGD